MKRVFLISMVCVSLSSCTYEEIVKYFNDNPNNEQKKDINTIQQSNTSKSQEEIDRGGGRPQ